MFQQVNSSLNTALKHFTGNDGDNALLTRLTESVQDLKSKLGPSEHSSNRNNGEEIESLKAVLLRCERKLDQLLTANADLDALSIADPLALLREVIST